MAEPQVIVCEGQCTVTVVHEFNIPLLNLTASEGVVISGAILLVWVVGWGIRQVARAIRLSDGNNQPEWEN